MQDCAGPGPGEKIRKDAMMYNCKLSGHTTLPQNLTGWGFFFKLEKSSHVKVNHFIVA